MERKIIKPNIFFLFLFLILLSLSVGATGVCQLDKEIYHPGETATVSCACTSPLEEGDAGFFVWWNDTSVVRKVATNSLDCRTSLFGDSYTFPRGNTNYSGNVTFNTTSNQWDDPDDIVDNFFNVTGGHITDCIIADITGSPSTTLGELAAVKFKVLDSITEDPLVHMTCQADGYDVNGNPIVFEPYGPGDLGYRYSTASGEVGFQRLMDEAVWEIDTTYLYEFHCYNLPNTTPHIAFDEETGSAVPFHSCNAQALFTTAAQDLRDINGDASYKFLIFAVIVFFGFIFIFFMHYFSQDPGSCIAFGFFGMTVFIVTGAMIFLGWQPIDPGIVTGDVDPNIALALTSIIIGIYALLYSMYLFFFGRKQKREDNEREKNRREFELP